MSPRSQHPDESRHPEYRPTLPPIHDLFGRELSQPPHPPRSASQPGYSPSAHFSQLAFSDDPPYRGDPARPPQSSPSYSHSHHAPSRSLSQPHASASTVARPYTPSRGADQPRQPPPPTHAPTSDRARSYANPTPNLYSYTPYAADQNAPQQWGRSGSSYHDAYPRPSGMVAGQPTAYWGHQPPSRHQEVALGAAHASAGDHAATASRYECSYCGRGFTRPSSLRIHLHSHTGERPYACTFDGCDRTFSVQSNMRRHARTHTQPPGTVQEENDDSDSSRSGHRSGPSV